MQLPTDPSADDDQSAGAQMMPLPECDDDSKCFW